MDLIKRMQELERQQITMHGILLGVLGLAMLLISLNLHGSNFRDFLSGLFLGLSIIEMLVGIYYISRNYAKK